METLELAVSDSYAYLAQPGELRVIDVSNPAQPVEAGFYPLPQKEESYAVDLEYTNGYIYVTTNSELFILQYIGAISDTTH